VLKDTTSLPEADIYGFRVTVYLLQLFPRSRCLPKVFHKSLTMSCQNIVGSDCGYRGDCVPLANNESACVCQKGWSQNLEWNFAADKEDMSTSVCHFNVKIIRSLYIALIILCCVQTVILMRNVRTIRQIKRRSGWIALAFCVLIMSAFRVVKPESGYSESYGFSLLFTMAILIVIYQAIHFMVDYLKYVAKKLEYMQGFKVELATKVFQYLVVIGLLYFATCSILVLFVPSLESDTKGGLFRSVMAYFTFLYLYQTIFVFAALSEMISDMNLILDKSRSMKSRNVFTGHGTDFEFKIQKSIPKAIATRKKNVILGTILVVACLLPALAPDWVLFLTYLGPIFFLIHYTFSVFHLLGKAGRNKNHSRSSGSTERTNTSPNFSGQQPWRLTGTNISAISATSASEREV